MPFMSIAKRPVRNKLKWLAAWRDVKKKIERDIRCSVNSYARNLGPMLPSLMMTVVSSRPKMPLRNPLSKRKRGAIGQSQNITKRNHFSGIRPFGLP